MITFAAADDAAARADWARLLQDFPAARVHADARWLDVVGRAYGARGSFAFERDVSGAVQTTLAGYESRTLRGWPTFHSLRHGLLSRGDWPTDALIDAVGQTCRARGCIEAVVGGGLQPPPGPYRASTRFAVGLDLAAGSQPLWEGFRDKVRNTIRKAERGGLTVSRDPAHLQAFHAIHARAMTERHGRVRALSFFRTLLSVFGDDARLYSALDGNSVCGAMVVIVTGGHATYPFGAFDEQARRLGANSLLLWHVARDLAGDGVRELDLGPSAQGSGAYRFKIHMGGTPQSLHYIDLLQPARPPIADTAGERAASARPLGRLDRAIECLPLPLRIQARTWLGRKGRLL